MGIEILVVSSNIALWDYCEEPDVYTYEYLGNIGENFYSKQVNIKNKSVKQFLYVNINVNTIFNFKQVEQLNKEIKILEIENILSKDDLKVLKKGIKIILENQDLYLKFEYD